MVNAQEWLDKNYPNKQEVKEISLGDYQGWIEGELIITDFPNLEEIELKHQLNLTKLQINNCPCLSKLICHRGKLSKFTISYCPSLKELRVVGVKLDNLDTNYLPNLEILDVGNNEFRELNISAYPKLKGFYCANNFLTNLDLRQNSKLEILGISNNNFSKQDLSFLNHLSSLKKLGLGNDKSEKINQGIYNRFCGSLKPLEDMNNLDYLDISNTDVNSGIEYLPHDLREIKHSIKEKPQSKVKEINRQLEFFNNQKQKKWEESSFALEEIDQWLEIGLKADEYDFADYLKKQGLGPQKIGNKLDKLRANAKYFLGGIQAQEWLDKVYIKEVRKTVEFLDISNKELKGNLDLNDFINLKSVNISGNPRLGKLKNKKPEATVICRKYVNAQQWLDKNYPKEQRKNITILNINGKDLEGRLDLTDFVNLKDLFCGHNQLTSLNISGLNKLMILQCPNNRLTDLNLNNCSNITRLIASQNNLGEINLSSLSNEKIKHIDFEHNMFLGDDLTIFSRFVNLEELMLNETSFLDSSEDLKNLTKLDKFLIDNKDTDYEYEALVLNTPSILLLTQEENKVKENYSLEQTYYVKKEIYLRENYPFLWEIEQDKLLSKEELPAKLIDLRKIKTNNLETIKAEKTSDLIKKDTTKIKNYATLSYAWSGKIAENNLSIGGEKALTKAIKTCKLLGIDYLWMDQLCIDQTNIAEKNQEVPKMGQYYGNSSATLISINTKAIDETDKVDPEFMRRILKKIINSEWFTRSWTFQEGCLSKQTVFMFDDELIDGRTLARFWVISNYYDVASNTEKNLYEKLDDSLKEFITPVGRTYCKNENLRGRVNIKLSQALEAIKNRDRGIPIDGIYSVLGLLPYGKQAKVKYKEWDHQYTREELEKTLLEVMKIAIQEGYPEPLTWFGSRRNEPEKWWIPSIDENGSTNVVKAINIDYKPKSVEFSENGFKLTGSKHLIENTSRDERLKPLTNMLDVLGISTNNSANNSVFFLHGTKETLEKIKAGDVLVLPNQEQLKSDRSLAILVPGENNSDCPVDIVELIDKRASYKSIEQNLFIDMVNKKVVELEKNKFQTLIDRTAEAFKSLINECSTTQPCWLMERLQGEKKVSTEQTESEQLVPLISDDNQNLIDINPSFTPELIQTWINNGFTYESCKDWINIGMNINDYAFCAWLRDKNYIPEKILNDNNISINDLKQEFIQFQQQTQIIQPNIFPKKTEEENNQNLSTKILQLKEEIKETILEIEKTEKQLQSYYKDSEPNSAEIIKNFIEVNKKFTRNKEDDEARKDAEKLYEELKNRNLSEKIKRIIEDCEKLVSLELLLKEEQKEVQNLEENQQNTETVQAQIIYNPFKK